MDKRVDITYIAMDGTEFKDEEEAYIYESRLIYKKSGFRFYRKNRRIIQDIMLCYDEADYFTIDHSKIEENCEFVEMARYYLGWIFPDDILTNTYAKRYRYDYNEFCWKSVSKPVKK